MQVGSFFEFQIDTDFSCKFGLCGAADQQLPSSPSANSSSSGSGSLPLGVKAYAAVSYLTSYQHMGKANATCHGGCTCKEQTINGHIPQKHSIPCISKFEVS
jgi:hypothetical protein